VVIRARLTGMNPFLPCRHLSLIWTDCAFFPPYWRLYGNFMRQTPEMFAFAAKKRLAASCNGHARTRKPVQPNVFKEFAPMLEP
jgi:hypothetical protein